MAAETKPSKRVRDAKGHFLPGNPGGPGNPYAKKVAKLRSAALEAVTAKDVQKIIKSLVVLALEGNVPAAKLVLEYVLGKPLAEATLSVPNDGSGASVILRVLMPDIHEVEDADGDANAAE